MRRSAIRAITVAMVLVVLAPAAEAADGPSGATVVMRVRIVDNRFRPVSLTIERGTVVKWVNRGERNHTSTSDTGVWDSGILAPDETFRRRFRRLGVFEYGCTIHAGMDATITVV